MAFRNFINPPPGPGTGGMLANTAGNSASAQSHANPQGGQFVYGSQGGPGGSSGGPGGGPLGSSSGGVTGAGPGSPGTLSGGPGGSSSGGAGGSNGGPPLFPNPLCPVTQRSGYSTAGNVTSNCMTNTQLNCYLTPGPPPPPCGCNAPAGYGGPGPSGGSAVGGSIGGAAGGAAGGPGGGSGFHFANVKAY